MSTPIIHSSRNYEKFDFFKSNRPAAHYSSLKVSISDRNLTPYVPIMVVREDDKFYIIDGQNRFLACKELGFPIYYVIIEDGSERDIMVLNVNQVNWKPLNYLNYFVNKEVPMYILINDLLKECTELSLDSIKKVNGTHTMSKFRNGTIHLEEESFRRLREVNAVLRDLKGYFPEATQRTKTYSLLDILPKVSINQLMGQMKKYAGIMKPCPSVESFTREIQRVYNYKRRKKIILI